MEKFIIDEPIKKYFSDILNIPHGSYNEDKLVEYLINFAKDHNLKYELHPVNNLVIFKDASKGYEDHDSVMMQAHIDMVCEKTIESNHNFETDPIEVYVEDGLLKAKGTTLGADDGYGVAYMLAILAEDSLCHPALECVFTRCEEVGLVGAKEVDTTNLKAKKYINLDGGGEVSTTVTSSGGRRVSINRSVVRVFNTSPTYKMTVSGLLGGHSGGMIDKERSNAVKIAFRILRNLHRDNHLVKLVSINGGAKENAIAKDCVVVFSSDTDVSDLINSYKDEIYEEIKDYEKDFFVSVENIETSKDSICPNCSKQIIQMIDLLPYGMIHKNLGLNVPYCSCNLGIINMNEEELKIMYSLRSPLKSYREMMTNNIKDIASLFNSTIEISNDYGGWGYSSESKLRDILKEVLKEKGIELECKATHGGLETGIFKEKMSDLDIITYGPLSYNAHTPNECLDLESFSRAYKNLIEVLKRC